MTVLPDSRTGLQRAVFFDKDGTLVHDVPYNVDPERINVYPEVGTVLAALSEQGYKLLVVSNQPGVAQGYFDELAVERAGAAMIKQLRDLGVDVSGFYYCPHHPDGRDRRYALRCDCRKPKPGLIIRAAREHRIDLSRSWMVGDILNDVEAGKRAGCRAILVDRGNETEWIKGAQRTPDHVVQNLRGILDHLDVYSGATL